MSQKPKFGIYININTMAVVRINSPYWIPSEPDWKFLTDDVNTTMVEIRRLAQESRLAKEPNKLNWTTIPQKNQ